MTYSVDNIIPVNVLLEPSGLSYANFSSAFAYAVDDDLKDSGSLETDDYKDYSSLDEVKEDFSEDSPPELIARRWFAQVPTPPELSIWMWDPSEDSPAEVAGKAIDETWRYWHFFPASVFDKEDSDYSEDDVKALVDWADSNNTHTPFTITDPDAVDPDAESDLMSVMKERGNRHVYIGYRKESTVEDDKSQAYAHVQLAAAFYKFRPEGQRTAITGEYQVLPGVVGESLKTTEYNALKDKNGVFWTEIELQGESDSSRTINSRSMSSYGEFIDDVVNLDVFRNRLQVDGYNYIAGAGSKRPLTPRGYAGLLSTLEDTAKGFYDNGVLGRSEYKDKNDGEEKIAKFGYVFYSSPSDVFDLSDSQRRDREFPAVSMLAILARAGHTAEINVTVE